MNLEQLQTDLRDSLAAEQRYAEQAKELRALAAVPGLTVHQQLDYHRMESERIGMQRGQAIESNYLRDQIEAINSQREQFGRIYSGKPFKLDKLQAVGMDEMMDFAQEQAK